ncbi:MAG: PH domain-containing protein [Bryobacteraceae bacterium]|nr:PH domain-containing protein [Bryobacteraceae bacterium]
MNALVVRPSVKHVIAKYCFCGILVVLALVAYAQYPRTVPAWLPAVPAALFLWPLSQHIARQFTKVTVEGGRLRFETGMLSKSTRTMDLAKIQDVRVDQSIGQRILGVGMLSLETAGETSRLAIENIDDPQDVADRILTAAKGNAKGAGA